MVKRQSIAIAAIAWVLYAFLLFPSLIVVPMSFGDPVELSFPPKSFSLDLYRAFFGSAQWLSALANSTKVAAITATVATTLGTLAAYGIVRGRFGGKEALRIFLLSPLFIPSVVLALGLYLHFVPLGLINTDAGLILGHVMLATPYVLMVMIAALSQADERLEMAAKIMGCSSARILWHVVLPQVRAGLMSAFFFAFIISFDEVTIAWFVSGSETITLPVLMFRSIQIEVSPVIATAAALVTGLSVLGCATAVVVQRRKVGEQSR